MIIADVTFIGLGLMGTALARTAIKAGFETVVWNRTPEKVVPLVEQGARYFENVAKAISESPIIVVCVSGYDVSDTILRVPEVEAALKGRTLIQLTSGSTRLARNAALWAGAIGVRYVDGGIEGYPATIGKDDSMFIISGDEQGYQQAQPLLRTLAPVLHYLGDDPTRASAMYSAMLSGSFGLIFGVMNAVAICEATGISIEQYLQVVGPVFKTDIDLVTEMAQKCDEDNLDKTEAYLSVWNETLVPIIETLSDGGCNTELPTLMHEMLNRAEKEGLAKHDLAALIEMIRPAKTDKI